VTENAPSNAPLEGAATPPGTAERPVAITVICIIGFIGALLAMPIVFSDAAAAIGAWYPPYLGFSAAVGAGCMIGMWLMKKWGAYGYTAFTAINQVVMLVMGVWGIAALVIPGIVVFFALKYSSRMS